MLPVSSKQGFYFLFLLFFTLNLLSFGNIFNTSKKINQYKYQIANGLHERSEYLKDKIIVHVGGAIPSNSWCYPFQECDIRKKYRIIGLGWVSQMGHDIIFKKKNSINNLAVDFVDNEKILLAIDLYGQLERRLIEYYKTNHQCDIYFERDINIKSELFEQRIKLHWSNTYVSIEDGTPSPLKKNISFYKIKSDYGKGCGTGIAKETPQKYIFN